MLSLLLAASLLAPAAQDDDPRPPDPKVVEAALEDLEQAFRSKEVEERVGAIRRHASLADAEVIEAIARAFRDREAEVYLAAVEALRWQEHPAALEELHGAYVRLMKTKQLREQEELYLGVVKAIGQHGDPSSIRYLGDFNLSEATYRILQARILGLGNVHDPAAVEALFAMMRKAGRGRVQPYMDDFRMALMRLTGVDRGRSQDGWTRWYNDSRKDLELPEEPEVLPQDMERRWAAYWGLEWKKERGERRRKRGGDADGVREAA